MLNTLVIETLKILIYDLKLEMSYWASLRVDNLYYTNNDFVTLQEAYL